jgi:hypothetical protein
MKNATVTIKPMQKHINNGETKVLEFINNREANNYFTGLCDEKGYDYEFNSTGADAGGRGHDFEITLNLI